MYTIKFLAPIIAGLCFNNVSNGQGDFCNLDQPHPSMVRYYEPGKSCYVNGTFYTKCDEVNESI